jgi:hypothetical protein
MWIHANQLCTQKYVNDCLNLYAKLNRSYASQINTAPLKRIPDELFDEFTQQGYMPIRDYLFVNEAVPWNENEHIKEIMIKTVGNIWDEKATRDGLRKMSAKSQAQANDQESKESEVISRRILDKWRVKVRERQPLNYGNTELQKLMFDHRTQFKDKKVAIYGNRYVWIEAILLELGVGRVTVLDNQKVQYEQDDLLERVSFADFVERCLKEGKIEQYDHAISFSFVHQLGLGRFGAALNPNADLDAVHHLNCMLKPGGLLFLGIPVTQAEKGFIDFNAHRFYGSKRLELLFKGWKKIAESKLEGVHVVFVLRKESICT